MFAVPYRKNRRILSLRSSDFKNFKQDKYQLHANVSACLHTRTKPLSSIELLKGWPEEMHERSTFMCLHEVEYTDQQRALVNIAWTSGFKKTGRIFWQGERLLASQEMLFSRSQILYWKFMLIFLVKLSTHSLTHGAEPFLRSRQLWSYSRNSQHFIISEGLLPCSQEPFTGPYPEPDQISP
jgi:hypothetical protein